MVIPASISGGLLESAPGDSVLSILSDASPPDDLDSLTTGELRDSRPGSVIAGRYTLQERIGVGGMGEVWVAAQTEPVKRSVAVKLIKGGGLGPEAAARFLQERRTLAKLDRMRSTVNGLTTK